MSLRLVIADDHSVVLEGLRALLALEPDLEVAEVCADGVEAVEAAKVESPDVLIMDATMPHLGGLDAHEKLRNEGLEIPTVILSATLDDETILRCLQSGVEGIVLKESAASVLLEALKAVARGERWIPPELTTRAAELMARDEAEVEGGLTDRELEVVCEVAGGKSNKRVALDLGISESTVKLHLHSAFNKLEVSNRTQLSLLARERGWI